MKKFTKDDIKFIMENMLEKDIASFFEEKDRTEENINILKQFVKKNNLNDEGAQKVAFAISMGDISSIDDDDSFLYNLEIFEDEEDFITYIYNNWYIDTFLSALKTCCLNNNDNNKKNLVNCFASYKGNNIYYYNNLLFYNEIN